MDSQARGLALALEKVLKTNIVIENRDGASGAIGTEIVKSAKPDGYTLLFTTMQVVTMLPTIRPVNYQPSDFVPLGTVTTTPQVLAARADAPYKTLAELVAYAKANPDKVHLGHAGVGTSTYIEAAVFQEIVGVQFFEVPYRAVTAALLEQIAGRADLTMIIPPSVLRYVESGQIRLLGISTEQRYDLAPDVPTFKEQGVNFISNLRGVLYAPKGTPPAILRVLEKAVADAVQTPEFNDFLKSSRNSKLYLDSAETSRLLQEESEFWKVQFSKNLRLQKVKESAQ